MWSTFAHNLGFGKQQQAKDAEADLEKAKASYEQLNPPELTPEHPFLSDSYDAGPSALSGVAVDPRYKEAQLDQLGALRNLAANGGRNAASDANRARIEQSENANARGQRDAILQNANARGMGGSGAALLAQLSSSQNATNNQSARDLDVLGQDQNTAIQAGNAAANIGANMGNTDYAQQANKAQANDAIARFNAGQKTNVSGENAGIQNQAQQYNTGLQQTGYQNQFQKQAGIAGSNMAGVNYNQGQANTAAQQAGNILGGIGKGITAYATGGGSEAKRKDGNYGGGKIPGDSLVAGDSSLNDFVPIHVSPGEVVVPRTIAKSGNPHGIANFVMHPPQAKAHDIDKEAMLSALKNIRSRGR